MLGIFHSVSSESDNEVESEEEEQTVLYPLEDKYVDEKDKHRLRGPRL